MGSSSSKNIYYGMQNISKFWFRKIKTEFIKLGFEKNQNDQCLLMYKTNKIILLLYVNDCILFYENNKEFTKMIKAIQKMFNFIKQDIGTDVFEYLGIELIFEDSKVTMRQDGFIKTFKTAG